MTQPVEPQPELGVRAQLIQSLQNAQVQPDLAQTVYQQLGINAPNVRLQGNRDLVANLKPGDIVGWKGGEKPDGTYVGNMAVYAGNNQIIEKYFGNTRRRALRADDNTFGLPVALPEDNPDFLNGQ